MLISGIVMLVIGIGLLIGSWMDMNWLMTQPNAEFMNAITGSRARTRIVYIVISALLLAVGFFLLFQSIR